MKNTLLKWLVALGILLTVNNNMRTQASKARRVLKDNEIVEFVECCIKKGCPMFVLRKDSRTCRVWFIGNTLSCRCEEPPKVGSIH